MGLMDSIIGAESGGDPNAVNPRSSASGAGQFLDGTWVDTMRAARPDLAQGKTDDELIALKTDPQLSREMTQAYAAQNQAVLSKNGLPVTDGNTYLAHFAGPGGAVKVLQADPNAPVSSILGPAVVKANPFLANMTAADLQAWAGRKMGGSAPQPQVAQATPVAPANAPVEPQQPVQPAPVFSLPQGGGMAPQQQASADPQQAPIFFAPRRSPDISKLKAALQATMTGRG